MLYNNRLHLNNGTEEIRQNLAQFLSSAWSEMTVNLGNSEKRRSEREQAMNRILKSRRATAKLGAALIAVMGLSLILAPGTARAGAVEDPKGFFLGLKFASVTLNTDQSSSVFFIKENGSGVQLDIGYRFNPVFMLELVIGGSNHNTSDPAIDARTAAVQIFGHYRFSPERSFRPYLKGGFGGYALLLESGSTNLQFSGGGVAFGGGFRFFFSPKFSLGVDLTANLIRYDEAKLSLSELTYQSELEADGSVTTLGVSFGYSF
jgi:hypothetical protein